MPYNPGITYDNSGLTRGIMQGSASIAAGLEKYQEQNKAMVQNSKYAEGIFKTNPEIQKRLGMSPEEFTMQAGQDKIAQISGAIASIHNEAEQQKTKTEAAQASLLAQHQAYYQQLNEQDTALGNALTRFAQPDSSTMPGQQQSPTFPLGGQQPDDGGVPPGSPDVNAPGGAMPGGPQADSGAAFQQNLQRFMSTPGLGGANAVKGLEALRYFMPKNSKEILPLGKVVDLGGGVKMYGRGEGNAPEIRNDPVVKAEKKVSSLNDDALYSKDPTVVAKYLQTIKDPEERALAVAAAHAFQHIFPPPPDVMNRMAPPGTFPGEPGYPLQPDKPGTAIGAKPGSTGSYSGQQEPPKKGQRKIIQGKLTEFDGKNFVEVMPKQ